MIQCQDLCLKHPHVMLQLQKGNPGANNPPEVLEALPKEELLIICEWTDLEEATKTICIEGKQLWREFVQITCTNCPACTGIIKMLKKQKIDWQD